MFIPKRPHAVLARAQRSAVKRALCPDSAPFWAALTALASGCALQVHEGDGLVSDGREIQISPAMVADAGRPDTGLGGAGQGCKQLALFTQTVMPLLTKKSEGVPIPGSPPAEPQSCVECHDGTKQKAFAAVAMDPKDPSFTCYVAVVLGATMADASQAELLTSSDPNRPDKVHDFKFKNIDDYNHYRDAVVAWLNAERQ